MKKYFSVIIVVLLLFVPVMAQAVQSMEDARIAKSEQYEKPAVQQKFTASNAINSIKNSITGLKNQVVALKAAIVKKDTETAAAIAKKDTETAAAIVKKDTETAQEIKNVGKKIDTFDQKLTGRDGVFAKINAKIDAVDSALFWMAVSMILCFIVGLVCLGIFLARKIKNIIPEVKDAAETGAAMGVGAMDKKLDELPEKTANEINKFDSSPFMFENGEVPGYHVEYNPTGMKDKVYQVLYIPKDPDTDDPEAFQRIVRTNRKEAEYSILSTLKKVLGGKSNPNTPQGKLEIAMMDHMQKTGELKIIKIS